MTKSKHIVSRSNRSVAYRFPNNYGATVIRHGIGGKGGYLVFGLPNYEIVVRKYHSSNNKDYTLDDSTSVTDDVIGWVYADEIDKHLSKIESL
jgi:hypothetical protein